MPTISSRACARCAPSSAWLRLARTAVSSSLSTPSASVRGLMLISMLNCASSVCHASSAIISSTWAFAIAGSPVSSVMLSSISSPIERRSPSNRASASMRAKTSRHRLTFSRYRLRSSPVKTLASTSSPTWPSLPASAGAYKLRACRRHEQLLGGALVGCADVLGHEVGGADEIDGDRADLAAHEHHVGALERDGRGLGGGAAREPAARLGVRGGVVGGGQLPHGMGEVADGAGQVLGHVLAVAHEGDHVAREHARVADRVVDLRDAALVTV